jgi:tetratricopeptide (TPR) repeat protein
MKIKDALSGILALLVIAGGIGGIWFYQKDKSRNDLAVRITSLGPPAGGIPSTVEGLKIAIAAYEAQIEQHVKDAAQTGIYWKILATRLQDKALHLEALEALEQALYYYPEDPALHYMTGLSSAYAAKDAHDISGKDGNRRERYFALAEEAYLRAVELEGSYLKPRYALGVLYLFELDRPADAIPHLLRYLEISTRDLEAMFLLARAYYMIDEDGEALKLYERILGITKDAKMREEAENNRRIIRERLYE